MLDALHYGRERYDRRAWSDAYKSLTAADQDTPLDTDDLHLLASSAFLSGRDLDFQRCIERLHRMHLDKNERQPAARCAFWLCLTMMLRGEPAQSSGWQARGQRLIDGCDCVEQGYLLLPLAEQQLDAGKPDAALDTSISAAGIGARFDDAELLAAARHLQGRALIQQWQVPRGLVLLDETMLSVVAGELSPLMTALMYCSVIGACEQVYALNRAREWTSALSGWCELNPEFTFTGKCLVYRAEIMRFRGAWADALTEADRACAAARQIERHPPAAAFYQKAEVHRLRGEFGEAEEAFASASRCGWEPQPGLALLRLAQGRVDVAAATIRRLIAGATDRLQRAKLLPACIEILLRVGDRSDAKRACAELAEIADGLDADALRAAAAQGQAAIALAEADAQAAIEPLRRAFDLWTRLEAPYEAARVRVLMGQACRTLGDDEAAEFEFEAARAALERLGGQPDLAVLEALAAEGDQRKSHVLTNRELHVLQLIAAGCTNKEIGAQLGLSERTIDRHVSNILGKLDVPSRAAATAYGYDHKLL